MMEGIVYGAVNYNNVSSTFPTMPSSSAVTTTPTVSNSTDWWNIGGTITNGIGWFFGMLGYIIGWVGAILGMIAAALFGTFLPLSIVNAFGLIILVVGIVS